MRNSSIWQTVSTLDAQEAQQRPEGPQKVIVFSIFVEALHIMADTLAHSKLGFVMLHGQMDLDERAQASSAHVPRDHEGCDIGFA